MTMKREAKAEALTQYATTAATPQRTFAPTQIAKYGRWMPGTMKAKIDLSIARDSRSRSRGTKVLSQIFRKR